MAGWDDLGRVLAGGVNTEAAYQRGQTKAAQLEGLIAQARIKKSEADARANLPGALTKLDAPADLATLFAAGIDPRQLSGYTGDMQEQGFRGDAASRALAGDWGGANAALMGVANGPQQLAKIEGQNLLGNVFLEGGGGISTTEQGRSSMAADAARARASDASAANSYASANATRERLNLAKEQFALERAGRWNPGGKPVTGAGGAAGAAGGGMNGRQIAGTSIQREMVLNQVAAQTGTARSEVNRLLAEGDPERGLTGPQAVADLMRTKGERFFQGRILGNIPLLSEWANQDSSPYSEGAARGQAMINDPTGPITNSDVEGARVTVPNFRQPIGVQSNLVESLLRSSMPAASDVFSGATPPPGGTPAPAPGTRRRYNPATGRIE